MNNKGFAITTILNGTRDIVTIKETYNGLTGVRFENEQDIINFINDDGMRGLYCLTNNTCKYYSSRPGV